MLALPPALFYVSLATLKANLIIYIILFFSIKALVELIFLIQKKLVIVSNFITVFVSSILITPWLLSPSTKYLGVIKHKLSPIETQAVTSKQPVIIQSSIKKLLSFFSTSDLFWGASWPDYFVCYFILIAIVLFSLFCCIKKYPDFNTGEIHVLIAASVAPILSYIFLWLMGKTT